MVYWRLKYVQKLFRFYSFKLSFSIYQVIRISTQSYLKFDLLLKFILPILFPFQNARLYNPVIPTFYFFLVFSSLFFDHFFNRYFNIKPPSIHFRIIFWNVILPFCVQWKDTHLVLHSNGPCLSSWPKRCCCFSFLFQS